MISISLSTTALHCTSFDILIMSTSLEVIILQLYSIVDIDSIGTLSADRTMAGVGPSMYISTLCSTWGEEHSQTNPCQDPTTRAEIEQLRDSQAVEELGNRLQQRMCRINSVWDGYKQV